MSRTLKILLLIFATALALPLNPAAAKQDAANREAIQTLAQAVAGKQKKDPEAWFQLGIEYNRAGEVSKARDAFKQALKLRPQFIHARSALAYTYFVEKNYAEAEQEAYRASISLGATGDFVPYNVLATIRTQRYRDASLRDLAEADKALTKNPNDANWYLYKAEALIGLSLPEETIPPDLAFSTQPKPLPDEATRNTMREESRKRDREAADCLEKYLSLMPRAPIAAYLREQIEALRFYAQDREDAPSAEKLYGTADVSSKAVITYKPEPGFTPEARDAGLVGMVRLRATLAADGKVKNILVIMPLRYGLTEKTVKAAREIRFKPATVGGVPVSQLVILEYNFSVY